MLLSRISTFEIRDFFVSTHELEAHSGQVLPYPSYLRRMLQTEIQDFIWQHREADPGQLVLSAKKHPVFYRTAAKTERIPMAEIAAQIQALQKILLKIPDWYRPGMYFPLALSIEQASSAATAKFKAGLFRGKQMADLTGGLGIDACYFSRQFESLVYVEQNEQLLAAARHNFAILGVSNVTFVHERAESFLEKTEENFDLIYLDPARRDARKGKVFQLADCSPDVLKIKDLLLEKSQKVLLKTAPLLDLKQAASQLDSVSKIWVVAAEGDCREVLYLLEKNVPETEEIRITALAIQQENIQYFDFSWHEEQTAPCDFSIAQDYLYEPNPAVLKAGAFRSFAQKFGLSKLHPNTHLYTSTEFRPGLPARAFRIEQVCRYDKKAVQNHIPGGKANIACRNFPDPPDQVRRRLGLADGGDLYVFAATDAKAQKVLILCRKVYEQSG